MEINIGDKKIQCPACSSGNIHLKKHKPFRYEFKCDNPYCQTNKQPFEPKPDEGRLLTEDEIKEAGAYHSNPHSILEERLKAQDAKTVSHYQNYVELDPDQSLPNYQHEPIWERFTTKDVEQNMFDKGWRKIRT
ncbi:hypothetical protein LCGC14_0388070 [marine sediment metagenome]|uniref:Uncharacterized protein n=1 Tax=marine sediment metagenome TaxID=412755 RepID=A0A0F9T0K9_9ZZZZ